MDSLAEDIEQASTPKKMRLSRMNSQEEMTAQIKTENRQGQKQSSTITVVTSESTKWVLTEIAISFSASIKALEPYDVSE